MPGAELTEIVDPQNYKGKISVRLGPVALTLPDGSNSMSIDEANRSARIKAQGSDAKGRGAANATAAFHIEPAGDGSRVKIHTDLTLSGAVAQYGRGVGMIQATAAQIIGQFAKNLRSAAWRSNRRPPSPRSAAACAAADCSRCRPQAAPRNAAPRRRSRRRAALGQADLRLVADRARHLAADRRPVHRTPRSYCPPASKPVIERSDASRGSKIMSC